MRMATRDGSLELFGGYRRVSSLKPPRPHVRRWRSWRRCASEEVRRSRSTGGRLTTFQKLDREMGEFVKAQNVKGRMLPGQAGEVAANVVQIAAVSEEESSVRGVRRGVKWRCGWMFEQDSLYWETVRRQDVSGGEEKPDSWRRASRGEKKQYSGKLVLASGAGDSSSAVERDHGALGHHCMLTDHEESVSSGMELHLRRGTHALRRSQRGQRRLTEIHCDENGGDDVKYAHTSTEKGWPAVLKAKCEVLQMEKELANQKLRQQCAEMAQAAEMAHCLRASVQTILETAKRGTVSAPSTPGRLLVPEDSQACIRRRIQRLQTVNVQRDLEEQAKNVQNRIDSLRLKSQVRSEDSSFRPKNVISKTRLSSTSTTTQVLTSDGEDWAQVQEVLKQLRGKTGSLQFSCENWEKRAIFAESKAASLQIEEEKWRLEAQKSEERVRELERELTQVKATLEEVRNRHALEQSRLLGSGSNHGCTLVLQSMVTSHGSSTNCRNCVTSSDCESGGHHHTSPPPENHPATPKTSDNLPEVASGDHKVLDHGSDPPPSPNIILSPDRELSESSTSGQGGSSSSSRVHNCIQCAVILKPGEGEDESPTRTPKAGSHSFQTQSASTVKSEVEKSLSQKWFKQRPRNGIRPGTHQATPVSEARNSTVGNSPIPAKFLGAGRGNLAPSVMVRKPGPVYAGDVGRVSSPSHLEKRVPLREIKRNSAPSECS